MPSLNSIVSVQITKTAVNVSQQGFGIPLILGYHTNFVEPLRTYSSLEAVAEDFDKDELEYKAASAAFAQNPSPTSVIIGRRAAAPTQTIDVTPNAIEGAKYTLVLNGLTVFYVAQTGDVVADICTGLVAAIVAETGLDDILTATDNTTKVTLTGDAGVGFSFSGSATLTGTVDFQDATTDTSIDDDLDAMLAASKDWYGVVLTQRSKSAIEVAAQWVEANKRLMICSTNDADYKTSATSDIATSLKTSGYLRTATIWAPDSGDFACAAWLGKMLPQVPGSADFIYKTLAGVSVATLSDSEVVNITSKNGNYYIEQNDVNITVSGCVASGEWLDVTLGIDWLTARLSERIFALLAAQPKVPYTDAGIQSIAAEVYGQLQEGAENGLLTAGAFTVQAPRAKDVSSADKTARVLRNVKFTAQLAGSIHIVQVNGIVTV